MSEDKRHSPVVHVPPGGGRTVWLHGEPIKFYALGEDTGGAFTLFEQNVPPRERSLPHKHRHEDQAFFALEGDFEFVCDGRAFVAEAGSFVHVPRGTVHAFENVGSETGRLMIFSTPAGETERFFFEVGEEAPDASSPPPPKAPPEIGELLAMMRRYGMEVDSFALLRQISANPSSERYDSG